MLATNLAYALHQGGRGRILLVDLDLQFGDVAGAMSLRPEYTVANAIGAADDPTAIRSFLTSHPSGLFCLCAPANPAEADLIDPDQLNKMLALLRGDFDWVIVDTAAGIGEVTLGAIEQSTDVMLVTTTDLSSIQAMRKAVIALDQIGLDDHRRWYVLNRSNAKVGLDQADIEKALGIDIDATLPSSKSVPTAMNQGIPVLADDPRSPTAKAINSVLSMVAVEAAGDSRSWLERIRS
jgi:pilus assembly protein CpaE